MRFVLAKVAISIIATIPMMNPVITMSHLAPYESGTATKGEIIVRMPTATFTQGTRFGISISDLHPCRTRSLVRIRAAHACGDACRKGPLPFDVLIEQPPKGEVHAIYCPGSRQRGERGRRAADRRDARAHGALQ